MSKRKLSSDFSELQPTHMLLTICSCPPLILCPPFHDHTMLPPIACVLLMIRRWNHHLELLNCKNEKEEEPSLNLHVWSSFHLCQDNSQNKGITLRCVLWEDHNTLRRSSLCLGCQCLTTKWIWHQIKLLLSSPLKLCYNLSCV